MRKTILLFASTALAMLLAGGVVLAQAMPEVRVIPLQAQEAEEGVVPGEYIVVLKDQPAHPAPRAAEVAQRMAPRYGLAVKRTYEHALKGFAARIPDAQVDDVRSDPNVLFVSENRQFRANPRKPPPPDAEDPIDLTNPVERIDGEESSARAGTTGRSVNVGIAVLDTGIDPRHPELNVVGGKDCQSSGGYADDNGHGTAVAGNAAARDDNEGVTGVAPGAPLYAVKVLDGESRGNTATVLCGVDWVTAHADRIEVANMSLSAPGVDDGRCGLKERDALHRAICRSVERGVTYVVSAGNDNQNLKNTIPAAYNEVLTATAMADTDGEPGQAGPSRACERDKPAEFDDTAASFSNFAIAGSRDAAHTIAAPGVCNGTTSLGGFYTLGDGTSFAAPLVAGTAALYKARYPSAKPAEVRRQVRAEASQQPRSYGFRGDPRSPIGSRYYGYLVHAGGF